MFIRQEVMLDAESCRIRNCIANSWRNWSSVVEVATFAFELIPTRRYILSRLIQLDVLIYYVFSVTQYAFKSQPPCFQHEAEPFAICPPPLSALK